MMTTESDSLNQQLGQFSASAAAAGGNSI